MGVGTCSGAPAACAVPPRASECSRGEKAEPFLHPVNSTFDGMPFQPDTLHASSHSARRNSLLVYASFAIAALAIISPMVFLGNASGHDFTFHLSSWMEVARSWHEGIFYPRWAAEANYGFGEPRFIFYPPVSWMLGAALGSVFSWRVVPGLFIWLTLFSAGLSMHRLAREWLSPAAAAVCALLYLANPYHLIVVYYRSDFAELLVSALFPLAVYFAQQLGRKRSAIFLLSLVYAFLWLSNAPGAVVASYSLALIVTVYALVERRTRILVEGVAAAAAGLGLAAFYFIPAAWEQRWVNITRALDSGLRPSQNFLFTHSNDPDFVRFNWKVSAVAVGVMIVAWTAAAVTQHVRREMPALWWTLATLLAASTFLLLPLSNFAWNLVPKLQFVQFPWRWLVPMNLVACFFFAQATEKIRWRTIAWAVACLALAGLAVTLVPYAWWDSQDIPVLLEALQSGHGYEGTDEYAPLGCDRSEFPEHAPEATALNPPPGVHIQVERASELRILRVETPRPTTIALRLINYPAWQAQRDGVTIPIHSRAITGQALISVPVGASRIILRLTRTPDRLYANCLSIAIAAFLLAQAIASSHRG
jgi:hypothetical protein